MDRVQFATVVEDLGVGRLGTLLPHINGQPLTQLLRRAGGPRSRRDSELDLPGGAAGLVADGIRWPSRHYLGEPVLASFADDTALLGCSCGVYGCGPFSAVVTVARDVVTWSRYRFTDRDVTFTELRDLVFDRQDYESAVRATATVDDGRRAVRSRGVRGRSR